MNENEIVKHEDEMLNVDLQDGTGWNNAVLVKRGEDYFVVSTAAAVPGLEDVFPQNTIVVPSDENGWVDLNAAEPIYDEDNADRDEAFAWLDEHRPANAAA